MKQKTLIQEKSWDILVLLDACRYDIFKKTYQPYLSGSLTKCCSSGTNTPEWLQNTFTQPYQDTIYVSGNPYINGLGVTFRQSKKNPAKNFYKVIDVWANRFSPVFKTVHPIELNKAFFKWQTIHPDKRYIIHYVQPHVPFIVVPKKYLPESGWFNPSLKKNGRSDLKNFLWKEVVNKHYVPRSIVWQLQKILRKTPDPVGKIYLDHGWEGIRTGYTDNLRFALKHVSSLLEHTDGKNIVVTADHGEYLGERGKFGHGGRANPVLLEVPWLSVTDNNKD